MSGRYLMERGWQDHPLFDGEPYSLRDAWEWIIANACYTEVKRKINGTIITLKRGQLSYSIRFLADKFLWHRTKVDRFLKKLKTETMIETVIESGQNVITVCNYDEYQTLEKVNETVIKTDSETGARQERDRSETKNNKGINKENNNDDYYCAREAEKNQNKIKEIYDWLEIHFNSPAKFYITAPISAWLRWGADFELDIKPVAERQKATKGAPSQLEWLDTAIQSSIRQRHKPMPDVPPPKGSDEPYLNPSAKFQNDLLEVAKRRLKLMEEEDEKQSNGSNHGNHPPDDAKLPPTAPPEGARTVGSDGMRH